MLLSTSAVQFLLDQTRQGILHLQTLRSDLISGGGEYNLAPPEPSSLPPLPPIPVPPFRQAYPAPKASASTIRPQVRPSLPKGHFLSGALTRAECIEAFNAQWPSSDGSGYESQSSSGDVHTAAARLEYGGSAVYVELGALAVWILLRVVRMDGTREDGADASAVEVESIKVCEGHAPVHAIPSGQFAGVNQHLTSLRLSLAEVLYRLAPLPALLKEKCVFCSKYLNKADGLPACTGLVRDPLKRRRRETGLKRQDADQRQVDRWVIWHESCHASR